MLKIKEVDRNSFEGKKIINDIYNLRKESYGKLGWLPFSKNKSMLIKDDFDKNPRTLHFAIYEDDKIIGTHRGTIYSNTHKTPIFNDGYSFDLFNIDTNSVSEMTRLVLKQDGKYPGCVLQLVYNSIKHMLNYSDKVCSVTNLSSKKLIEHIGSKQVNEELGFIIDREGEKKLVISGVPMVSDSGMLNHELPLHKYPFKRTLYILKDYNIDKRYDKLFSRNKGLIEQSDQDILKNASVGIAGVGGVGGIQIALLARAGIGKFIISDPEKYDHSDINRQYGAYASTLHKNKAEVMKKILLDINPESDISVYKDGITKENVKDFVSNSDVVIDAIEYFALEEKIMLHKESRNQRKFVFTSPIIGFGSSLLVFDPNGMKFEDYFDITKNKQMNMNNYCPRYPEYMDNGIYGEVQKGKMPMPSFSASTALSGSMLATDLVLHLLNKKKPIVAPNIKIIDFFRDSIDIMKVK